MKLVILESLLVFEPLMLHGCALGYCYFDTDSFVICRNLTAWLFNVSHVKKMVQRRIDTRALLTVYPAFYTVVLKA